MIQGGPGVVSCDCENLEFFLNLCLVLKQYSNIYFCNYHSFIILKNIMETPELFVHRWQIAPAPVAITMVEVNLKRTFSSGEWEKGVAIKDNVIIVEKVGIWPMCAPSKYEVATKTDKKEERKMIPTAALIQPYNLFYFY